jgi:hypothetical protein
MLKGISVDSSIVLPEIPAIKFKSSTKLAHAQLNRIWFEWNEMMLENEN